jgi:hypothetical protein
MKFSAGTGGLDPSAWNFASTTTTLLVCSDLTLLRGTMRHFF